MKARVLTKGMLVVFLLTIGVNRSAAKQTAGEIGGQVGRAVNVEDCIRMAMLGDPGYFAGGPALDLAKFSPDGKNFVIVLRKGNLEQNTNEFSLLLWRTDEVFHSRPPQVLITMGSSSNRNAIGDVKWLNDNETVTFLGERPGELRQLYTFNIRTHVLKKITDHMTSLISYGVTPDGDKIAFTAEPPLKTLWDEKARRKGIAISPKQPLWVLVRGEQGTGYGFHPQLFLQTKLHGSQQITTPDVISSGPSISPDGKYIALRTVIANMPEAWQQYSDRSHFAAVGQRMGWIERYTLIDTDSKTSHPLLNSPLAIASSSRAAWAPDGHSVVITHTYLPLDKTDGEERKERQSKWFAVEVQVPSGEYTKVGDDDLKRLLLLNWKPETNQLVFEASPPSENHKPGSRVTLRKRGAKWEEVAVAKSEESRLEIVVDEGINTPPRIFALNSATHGKTLLLDLNPGFSQLKFGKVEDLQFMDLAGRERRAGLYYPVDFAAGKKYPLVIQTHGWYTGRFWINGFSTTSNAAQPLAGKGIVVLQLDEVEPDVQGTPKDAIQAMTAYERAIDYLDERGIIDRNHVGIIGFSQTCYYVKYALTHSKYHFAAASVADGYDGGYFDYQLNAPTSPEFAALQEGEIGAVPFGAGLELWMQNSPGFNVDKVHTPLLISALRPDSVIIEWEWFAALTRLRKPVEMIYLENGSHELQKPWDRLISQGANVDWFVFWLKEEEDPDPGKAEQYVRWRQLRSKQEESEAR